MEIIDGLIGGAFRNEEEKAIVRRVVHATGDPELAGLVDVHPDAVRAAMRVFSTGKKIVVDVKMVEAGIANQAAKLGIQVYCSIDDPSVVEQAAVQKKTRAMMAMRHLAGHITGNMVVVGNAPTALRELIDLTAAGKVSPALIVATPVGFVGAAETKSDLTGLDVPYITLHGTRGGSAVAAAIVNALLKLYRQG